MSLVAMPALFYVVSVLPMWASASCVSHELLKCINDASTFWPKCDPSQSKSVPFPTLHGRTPADYGFFCTEEWADALNAMLSDTVVDKCNDKDAQIKLLAEVAWETGYFSTLFQPADGGAGLVHMIPNNWNINAQDIDELFAGGGAVQRLQQKGAEFFQTPNDGWRSAAAWYKRTNRVIPGCGLDLFDQSFATQTRCILGRPNDRSEAFGIVSNCFDSLGTTSPTTARPSTTANPGSTTSSSTFLARTLTTTLPSTSHVGGESCRSCSTCVSMPGNPHAATDAHCSPCAMDGQAWWPCNVDGLCRCAGRPVSTTLTVSETTAPVSTTLSSSTARQESTTLSATSSSTTLTSSTAQMSTTALPSTSHVGESCKTCGECVSMPGNPHSATDSQCSPCAMDGQAWWPCNVDGLCQCAGGLVSTTITVSETAAPVSTTATVSETAEPPSESCKTCRRCMSVPGNLQAATDLQCSPCALDGQAWWPCNVQGLCQCG